AGFRTGTAIALDCTVARGCGCAGLMSTGANAPPDRASGTCCCSPLPASGGCAWEFPGRD
ncbi:MAG: hypothetical protein WAM77_18315, partial [Xanthobacteraceae bacterium]